MSFNKKLENPLFWTSGFKSSKVSKLFWNVFENHKLRACLLKTLAVLICEILSHLSIFSSSGHFPVPSLDSGVLQSTLEPQTSHRQMYWPGYNTLKNFGIVENISKRLTHHLHSWNWTFWCICVQCVSLKGGFVSWRTLWLLPWIFTGYNFTIL